RTSSMLAWAKRPFAGMFLMEMEFIARLIEGTPGCISVWQPRDILPGYASIRRIPTWSTSQRLAMLMAPTLSEAFTGLGMVARPGSISFFAARRLEPLIFPWTLSTHEYSMQPSGKQAVSLTH